MASAKRLPSVRGSNGVAACLDFDLQTLADLGPDVVVLACDLGQRLDAVEFGDLVGQRLDSRRRVENGGVQPAERDGLGRRRALLRVPDPAFPTFQFVGREALTGRCRLFAPVFRRDLRHMGSRNLDRVTEHAVVFEAQRSDSGAFPLPLFEGREVVLALRRVGPDRVYGGIRAIPEVTRVGLAASCRWGVVEERRPQPGAQFGLRGRERCPFVKSGRCLERAAERDQGPRTPGPRRQRRTAQRPLEIPDLAQRISQPGTLAIGFEPALDARLAGPDLRGTPERRADPVDEPPGPHRGSGAVQVREQGPVSSAVREVRDQLEMSSGPSIEHQPVRE